MRKLKKLNLIYGVGDVLHTHLNINPFAEEEIEDVLVRADIKDLSNFAEEAEVTEIIAKDVIDYLPLSQIEKVLSHWVSRLRHGGTIVVGGTDLYEVAKDFSQYRMDITSAIKLLHGEQTKPYLIKRVNFTVMGMVEYLSGMGLKIQKKRVNNHAMIVEAKRP
jgi:predicted TPR repeat methyltransferase